MIKVGFDMAVALVLSGVILVTFAVWLRGWRRDEIRGGAEEDMAGNMRQCPYCRHVCVDDRCQKIMICPVCKSYFEEEAP